MNDKITPLTESLIDKLSAKMEAELKRYQLYLSALSTSEVMDHSYELTIKKDIIYALDSVYCHLSPERCYALLKSHEPLNEIYIAFRDSGASWIDEICECINSHADKEIEKEKGVSKI